MTEKPTEMLPCPFCGSPGEVDHGGDETWILGCANEACVAWLIDQGYARKADAIAAWNKRVKP